MTEVHVTRNSKGKVIFGDVNYWQGARWIKRRANLCDVYAVVRKKADQAATRVSGTRFARHIIFVLTLDEYNLNHDTLSQQSDFSLQNKKIILTYTNAKKNEYIEVPHKNSKAPCR